MKYDSSRRAINHPCVGEHWGGGIWVGVAVRLGKSGEEGSVLSQKSEIPSGSKRPIVHFGASVNDPPKSIDLNGGENELFFGPGMEQSPRECPALG
ncbi:hypothetical protein AVEN_65817-1 [Araneus ventricosus]|uniref:Uncharacterized protein n=1 Tax=Araneus ventricosus TaxID=182803 RepID=A0A4Y2RDR1_ARAVE|nr:hypothetical protein AVEN_65817-1 [Araneus ventricosus]